MDSVVNVMVISQMSAVRDQLREAIRGDEDLRLIGLAGDPSEGAELLTSLCPDVALLHADAGGQLQGSSPVLQASAEPTTRVLLCGRHVNPCQTIRTTTLGCWGFLDLELSNRMIVKAIRSVSRGELWITRKTLSEAFLDASRLLGAPHEMRATLTNREKELVGWIAQGCSNKEIAKHLDISHHTVKTHVHRILRKLRVRSRVQLATQVADGHDLASLDARGALPH